MEEAAINRIILQDNTVENHPFPFAYQVKYANRGENAVTTAQP